MIVVPTWSYVSPDKIFESQIARWCRPYAIIEFHKTNWTGNWATQMQVEGSAAAINVWNYFGMEYRMHLLSDLNGIWFEVKQQHG